MVSRVRRHPGRVAGAAVLVALLGVGSYFLISHLRVESELRKARAALERYRNAEAAPLILDVLRRRPEHPEALLLGARSARRGGAFADADDLLRRYERVRGIDDDLILERTLLSAERGDLDAVREFCRVRVEQGHPSTGLILEALSQGAIRAYRLADAEKFLVMWAGWNADDPRAHLLRGILAETRDQPAEAVKSYQRVLDLDPEYDEARLRLGRLLTSQNRAGEALPLLEEVRRRLPDNVEAKLHLAVCLDLLGRQPEAEQLLDEVLAVDAHNGAALAERGRLARRSGDLARAETLFRDAVAVDPGDLSTRYQLSQVLTQRGKLEEAREQERRAKEIDRNVIRMRELMAGPLQVRPHDPALHCEVANIALESGLPQQALRWLRSALEINPDFGPAHLGLANYYRRMANPAMAARHLELARKAGVVPPPDAEGAVPGSGMP